MIIVSKRPYGSGVSEAESLEFDTKSMKEVFDALGIKITRNQLYSFTKHLQRSDASIVHGDWVYTFRYLGSFPSFEGVV